jgi:hypothetical protein
MDEKVKISLLLAFIVHSVLVASNFQERTFDSYAHMFFADHYRKAWFSLWEPRWYGGFYVSTYPPLAHQTIALLSFLIGLEYSYQLLTLLLLILLPLAIYNFSKIFVSENAAGYSSMLSVFLPSILTTAYIFGQFTTIFSLVLLLFSMNYLNMFLKHEGRLNYFISLCLLVASICSHNFTSFFFLPIVFATLLLKFILKRNLRAVVYLIILFITALTISTILLWPFICHLLNITSGASQKPIFHASRTNLFVNLNAFVYFFLLMYGPIVILIPMSIALVVKRKELSILPLLISGIILFLLGLGGTTPIPSLLFGHFWELLTYDRFTLWASIIFLPLFGLIFEKNQKNMKIFKGLFLALIIFTAIIFNVSIKAQYLPEKVNLEPVLEFLSKDGNWRWRYLTLEFGAAQLSKLSILTNATTIDGFYVHARYDPVLMNSGIETIDGARHWNNGTSVLKYILAHAKEYKIKFVFCASPFYYDILSENNFTMLFSQDNTRDGRLGRITIWAYKDEVPQLSEDEIKLDYDKIDLQELIWGLIPLVLLLAIVCSAVQHLRCRFNDSIIRAFSLDQDCFTPLFSVILPRNSSACQYYLSFKIFIVKRFRFLMMKAIYMLLGMRGMWKEALKNEMNKS